MQSASGTGGARWTVQRFDFSLMGGELYRAAPADEPLKPSVSESCSCAAGKMLMAFLMEADGDLKLLILFVLESSAMLLSEHGRDAHR